MSLAPIRKRLLENLVDHADDAAVLAGRGRLVQLQDLLVVLPIDPASSLLLGAA